MKKKILTYCRGRCIYTASRARHICMLRDNWPVIDWREPIGLQERLEGRSSHNGVISVMSRDSLKGNRMFPIAREGGREVLWLSTVKCIVLLTLWFIILGCLGC